MTLRLTPDRRQLLRVARVVYAQTGDPDALQLMADALPDAIEDIEALTAGDPNHPVVRRRDPNHPVSAALAG